MEQQSSSQSIIYMSPHNKKFAIKHSQLSSLLQDEAAPPHFKNQFQQCMSVIRTPQKHNLASLKRELNKSSSSKPLPPFPEPFAHFENDLIDAAILSKGKESSLNEEHTPKNATIKKAKKFDELEMNQLLLASPKKEEVTPKREEPTPPLTLEEEYEELLLRLAHKETYVPPSVFFFKTSEENDKGLTKLICFDINPKNGRHVKFDHKARTCVPHFRCYGCKKDFSVAAALGGHLSKCPMKQRHFQKSEKYQELAFDDEDSSEMNEQEIKLNESDSSYPKPRRRNAKTLKKRAKRRTRQENYVRTRLPNASRLLLTRAAKLRAGLIIRETIKFNFQ